MADTREVVYVGSPDQILREQLAKDMEKLKDNPLDRTDAGGYYGNADGSGFHDAHGNPVGGKQATAKGAKVDQEGNVADARKAGLHLREPVTGGGAALGQPTSGAGAPTEAEEQGSTRPTRSGAKRGGAKRK
jgi:hypothetical protein